MCSEAQPTRAAATQSILQLDDIAPVTASSGTAELGLQLPRTVVVFIVLSGTDVCCGVRRALSDAGCLQWQNAVLGVEAVGASVAAGTGIQDGVGEDRSVVAAGVARLGFREPAGD